jgi:AraC-like DNA-binding protein
MTSPDPGSNADEHLAFSSRGRDPGEAFAAYARLYAAGSDVSRGEGPFRVDLKGWRMDSMLLFERRLSGVIHARGDRVAQDGFDHFVLYAVLSGELVGSAESGFDKARAGDVVLLDTSRATRTESRDAHFITVSVARHLIATAADPATLHGLLLRPPATLVLVDYLASLARRAPDLAADAMPTYARVLVDLLGGAMAARARRGAAARREDFLRRQMIEQHIEAHLADRALSAATICAQTGISRSALYRLFEGQGGVGHLIQARRIDALRAAIERGSAESLAELADRFGFASESHMSRLFAEATGDPPGAYRQTVRDMPAGDVRTATRRWQGWMSELL